MKPLAARATDPYRLETVVRACNLLKAFRDDEALRFKEISARTGLNQTIVFRLVRTLEQCEFLRKVGRYQYQSAVRLLGRKGFKIGYAGQAEDSPFSTAVTDGIRRAAARENIDLIVLDNHYSARIAMKNAERLIAERVDLAFEFQTYEKAAPAISSLFEEAGIPLVAIDIPHPGATFYGVNNYQVGLLAGRMLGRWAKEHWQGSVGEVLLLELKAAGGVPQLRLSGTEAGIRQILPGIPTECFVHVDCLGEFAIALDLVRRRLRHAPKRRTLISGVNEPSVLAALRAFEEAGRTSLCAAVGLGAIPEARTELRKPGTRLIGSIALFPEQYGDDLINLAMDILRKRHVPPAVYARHVLITHQNVTRFYPHDAIDDVRATAVEMLR